MPHNITEREIARLSDAEYRRRHDAANKQPCPTCNAPAGAGCAFLPGLAFVSAAYHLARWQAAESPSTTSAQGDKP